MIFQPKHGHQTAQSEGLRMLQTKCFSDGQTVSRTSFLTAGAIYVTFWNGQSDNQARFTQQLARYGESKFELLSQVLQSLFMQHNECLRGDKTCAIIPLCVTHCSQTTKTLNYCRERSGRQWDAARKRLWQQAFSLAFEWLVCFKHTEALRMGTHTGSINREFAMINVLSPSLVLGVVCLNENKWAVSDRWLLWQIWT